MVVEFLGIPRVRVGLAEVEVEAASLGQLFDRLAARYPALDDLITPAGLHPALAANLNGDEFVSDPSTILVEGDRLLILSADVGG